MKREYKELFHLRKPKSTPKKIWSQYVKSGDRKAHWRLNRDKTLLSGVIITVSGTSLVNAVLDLLKNPHPLTMIDFYQISGGLFGLLLAFVIVHIIDRAEELRQLRKKREQEELRQAIHEILKEHDL